MSSFFSLAYMGLFKPYKLISRLDHYDLELGTSVESVERKLKGNYGG